MKRKTFVGDFETTIYDEQDYTEVWASAMVELGTEDVKIFHSIGETFEYMISLDCDIVMYYHNLKFDGAFWIAYLLHDLGYKQASYSENGNEDMIKFFHTADMPSKSFKYSISDRGQWYSITIKVGRHIFELRDSLKLLPFSVNRIGKSFKTKHQKLDMEYKGFRYAGCEITDSEKEYIANDVLVVKEALETMFEQGHKQLTIGACCLMEYKKTLREDIEMIDDFDTMFPNIYEIKIDENIFGCDNAGDYVRKSYKGGWCYLVPEKAGKIYHNGITADVNSLYPSMMSAESGNKYPVRKPHFWVGNEIPHSAIGDNKYYFVRVKTRFYLKPDKLPCIQIKNNFLYNPRQWLTTSDIYNVYNGKNYKQYKTLYGEVKEAVVILTLTMTDFALIKEHYDLIDFEILDGCWFYAEVGIFDRYINKYKQLKLESTGAIRELAKLFLNNLYGKMASSRDSSFKYAYLKEDGSVAYKRVQEFEKNPGYIPVGSAITSYARNFTIRTAQKNYYGADKAGFIYADTDSIHCDLSPEELKGVVVHPRDFCCWKLEASWDEAIFTRQKTYIERVVKENLEEIEHPYYNVRCAGMPEKCKQLFLESMKGDDEEVWKTERTEEWENMTEEERQFVTEKRGLEDFKIGLKVPSKLMPHTIRGGVVLIETTYEMR